MKKKTISKILFDSIGKRVQSFSELAEVNKGKITKYCAIGAVGCENKYIKLIKTLDNWGDIEWELQGRDEERKILRDAGIPLKVIKQDFRSYISDGAIKAIAEKDTFHLKTELPLDTLIMSLNDSCGWSFEQIGKEIEKLEENYTITYEEKKK